MLPGASLLLLLDLDNTKLRCNEYYNDAKAALAALIRESLPHLSAAAIMQRFDAIDLAATAGPNGFSRERYPGAMEETVRVLHAEAGVRVPDRADERAYAIGAQVFDAPYAPYPGVIDMVAAYRATGARVGLCTKGDPVVQHQKLARHDLYRLFDTVAIVPKKTPEIWAGAIAVTRTPATERVVVIGDSLRDDIVPAAAVGAETVWIAGAIDAGWGYEQQHAPVEPTFTIQMTTDLPTVIPIPTA